jgi:hypothetical protein
MLSAKDAMAKLKEVRRLEKEKAEKDIQKMVDTELNIIETEIEKAIALSQTELNYIFQNRSHPIQMRTIVRLEEFGYVVNFIEKASAINISWDIDVNEL